jgi:hypothetical protein
LSEAHREFTARKEEFGLTTVEPFSETTTSQSFLICDLDRNWWEIAYLAS